LTGTRNDPPVPGRRAGRYRRAVRAGLATLAAVALTLPAVLAGSPAAADAWPYGSLSRPDTGGHSYCYHNVFTPNQTLHDQIALSMQRMQVQTEVEYSYHSSCQTHTDVRWQQREAGTDGEAFGTASCYSHWEDGRCDEWIIRINWDLIAGWDNPDLNNANQARKTSCHELGHTLGLAHYGNGDPYHNPPDWVMDNGEPQYIQSCMRSGVADSGALWTKSWGAHHIGHVNAWF